MTIICNGKVIGETGIRPGAAVAFENGVLVEPPAHPNPGDGIIDASGCYVSAGFIDLHTHGGGGFDFLDATPEAFLGAARLHAAHGTTTLIPTATSGSQDETMQMLRVFRALPTEHDGADMPGVHLEGPYFSPAQCGAQDPGFVRAPDPKEYRAILDSGAKILRWSFAPELPGSEAFARALHEAGVLASIGHSNADYDEVQRAYQWGCTHITHLYSCMSTVHRKNAYRYAGIVESAYLIDGMTSEIIADGVHLPAPLLQMVCRFIGPARTALVTDSMRGAGMPDGESVLGSLRHGQKVWIEDGVAKLPDRSAFAGSVATMDRLVRNMRALAHASLADAVRMATQTPAEIQGLTDRGTLTPGKRADIVLFDDALRVQRTIVGGRTVYCAARESHHANATAKEGSSTPCI